MGCQRRATIGPGCGNERAISNEYVCPLRRCWPTRTPCASFDRAVTGGVPGLGAPQAGRTITSLPARPVGRCTRHCLFGPPSFRVNSDQIQRIQLLLKSMCSVQSAGHSRSKTYISCMGRANDCGRTRSRIQNNGYVRVSSLLMLLYEESKGFLMHNYGSPIDVGPCQVMMCSGGGKGVSASFGSPEPQVTEQVSARRDRQHGRWSFETPTSEMS